jgi:hypothetical protein
MEEHAMVESARGYARTCGFIYALIFVAGLFGEVFVDGRLVIDGDAAATAAKIAGSDQLWRAGSFAQAVTLLCDVAVAWLLYILLAPVNRNLALLSALFRLAYVPVYAISVVAHYAALPLAQNHLPDATMFALREHNAAFALSLLFFGTHLFLAGYLIARVPILVQWLGIALEVAGACYVLNTATIFIAPHLHEVLFPWILLPPFVGELSLCIWLLVTHRFDAIKQNERDVSVSPKGVRAERANPQSNLEEIT